MGVHIEGVVLQVGGQIGAVIVYSTDFSRGKSLTLRHEDDRKQVMYANVVERVINGKREFAAVFPHVPAGNYELLGFFMQIPKVTVFPGLVAEVDMRVR